MNREVCAIIGICVIGLVMILLLVIAFLLPYINETFLIVSLCGELFLLVIAGFFIAQGVKK